MSAASPRTCVATVLVSTHQAALSVNALRATRAASWWWRTAWVCCQHIHTHTSIFQMKSQSILAEIIFPLLPCSFSPLPPCFHLHLPLFFSADRHWWMWEKPTVVSWRNLPEHRRELRVWMSHRTLAQHRWIFLWRWIIHHAARTHTHTRNIQYYLQVQYPTLYIMPNSLSLYAAPVRCKWVPAEWQPVQEWPVCQHARNLPVLLWHRLPSHTRPAELRRWVEQT